MDKVRCPYCGSAMGLWVDSYSDGTVGGAFYTCPDCKSDSPYIEYAEDIEAAAYAAAMQRWREPLKPLELGEVTGSEEPCVFLEIKGKEPILACDCVISPNLKGVNISFIGDRGCTLVAIFDYCKTWRCWLRRPTDEERKAVRWEERNENT